MEYIKKNNIANRAEHITAFLDEHNAFYSSYERRSCFLIGILIDGVLSAQQQGLNSKPFLKQLKGFQLSLRDLKGLVPKIVEKLDQYDKRKYYENIISLLAENFSNTEAEWKLSNVDINFYLLLGISMANKLYVDKTLEDDLDE